MTRKTKPSKYVDPMVDVAFRYLFGTEKNKNLLKGLLEHVFKKGILEITYDNTAQVGESLDSRNAYFDVFCKADDDTDFIVECQVREQEHFTERAVFYTSRAISNQAPKGEWDYNFCPVYFLGLTDFRLPESIRSSNDYVHRFSLRNEETGEIMTDNVQYVFMEVGPFTKAYEECRSFEERFLHYMKNLPKFVSEPDTHQDSYFQELLQAAEYLNMDKETQAKYDQRLKEMRDIKNVEDFMKKKAKEEGIAEGVKKGREEGRAELVKAMSSRGLSPEEISHDTGLSVEEIHAMLS